MQSHTDTNLVETENWDPSLDFIIKQMNGEWKVNNPQLELLYEKAKEFEGQLNRVSYNHIPRDQNKRADMLANQALLKGFDATNPLHCMNEYDV